MAFFDSSGDTSRTNVVGITPICKRRIKCPIAICQTAWRSTTLVASLEAEVHEPSVITSQERTYRSPASAHTAVRNFATDANPLETSIAHIRSEVNLSDRLTALDA